MILKLKKDDIKPAFDFMGLTALLDTGAEISVCNLSQAVFEQIFMNNFMNKEEYFINGFGGKSKGVKYTILTLVVGDMTFTQVPIFVPDTPTTKYKFIIAGTLFSPYSYTIDMGKHILEINSKK